MAILISLQHSSYAYTSTTAAADVFFPVSGNRHNNASRSCLRYCQLSDHQIPPLSPLQPRPRTARNDQPLLNKREICIKPNPGKKMGFRRVSCINATLPISLVSSISHDLCTSCKTIGADFAREYLSNVCVANEFQRNGFGYELLAKAKNVAKAWGISDLYVHVAVDNEAAENLYVKSGFTVET